MAAYQSRFIRRGNASLAFGKVSVSTPLSSCALILSRSILFEKSAQVRPVPWLELNTDVNFTRSADCGADIFDDVESGSLRRPASMATLHRSILSTQVTRGQGGIACPENMFGNPWLTKPLPSSP